MSETSVTVKGTIKTEQYKQSGIKRDKETSLTLSPNHLEIRDKTV